MRYRSISANKVNSANQSPSRRQTTINFVQEEEEEDEIIDMDDYLMVQPINAQPLPNHILIRDSAVFGNIHLKDLDLGCLAPSNLLAL